MIVCMCVCILRPLGKEDENAGWAGAKAMLSDVGLLKALQEYRKDDLGFPLQGDQWVRCVEARRALARCPSGWEDVVEEEVHDMPLKRGVALTSRASTWLRIMDIEPDVRLFQ